MTLQPAPPRARMDSGGEWLAAPVAAPTGTLGQANRSGRTPISIFTCIAICAHCYSFSEAYINSWWRISMAGPRPGRQRGVGGLPVGPELSNSCSSPSNQRAASSLPAPAPGRSRLAVFLQIPSRAERSGSRRLAASAGPSGDSALRPGRRCAQQGCLPLPGRARRLR